MINSKLNNNAGVFFEAGDMDETKSGSMAERFDMVQLPRVAILFERTLNCDDFAMEGAIERHEDARILGRLAADGCDSTERGNFACRQGARVSAIWGIVGVAFDTVGVDDDCWSFV